MTGIVSPAKAKAGARAVARARCASTPSLRAHVKGSLLRDTVKAYGCYGDKSRSGMKSRRATNHFLVACRAQADAEEPSREELISKLNASLDQEPLSGEELKGLIEARWGRLYDTRICRRRDGLGQMRLYLQVMWKYLGQRSFPMSEERYDEQLTAVAELITEWDCAEQIREEIPKCQKNPVIDTTGANAVMIALDLQLDNGMPRGAEWFL